MTGAQRGDFESPAGGHTGVTDADRETAAKFEAAVLDLFGAFDHSNDEERDRTTFRLAFAAVVAAARAGGGERIRAKVLAVLSEASERDRLGVPQLDWFDRLRAAVAPGGQR